jgi:hypothetical protein
MTIRQGICQGGPWDRKVKVNRSGMMAPDDTGKYYWRPASGPTPGQWIWFKTEDKNAAR